MSAKRTHKRVSNTANSGSPGVGEPEFLAVGKIRRPHGVRGEMQMSVWTDFPERLQPNKQVYVGKTYQPYQIKTVRDHHQALIISFDEFTSRDDVGNLRNQVVYVRADEIPALPDDGIYLHQLIGLKVISDEGESVLGIVTEIIETGANQVLLVRRHGKADLLLPDIDPVVLNINLKKGEILVHLIPGLVPDNQQ